MTDNLPPVIETAPWMLADGGALDVDLCPDCWERRAHIERYAWACKVCTGMRVLDFGCGVGYGSEMLANAGNGVMGIDCSCQALRFAIDRHMKPGGAMFWTTGLYPPVTNELFAREDFRFDACVAFEVLEHLPDPAEFIRTVPARHLIVSVPVRPTMHTNAHHKHDFTVESFEALVKQRFYIRSRWLQIEPQHFDPSIYVCHAEDLG